MMRYVVISRWVISLGLMLLLTACSIPQVTAQERLFLPLSLEWVTTINLPKIVFDGSPVGGWSAIAYDRQSNLLYALSDDRSNYGPARFYTISLTLDPFQVHLQTLTSLKTPQGNPYAPNTIDPEGILLTPDQTLWISSEGIANQLIPPALAEFDRHTGQWLNQLPIPQRYLPDGQGEDQQRGVQNNLGFESLTSNPIGSVPTTGEPLRLFVATEAALVQDRDPEAGDLIDTKVRWMHYLLSEGPPLLVSEHLYLLDPPAEGTLSQGLTEILALEEPGHFLTLERSFGIWGFKAKLFQGVTGSATDISNFKSLRRDLTDINPIRKQLVVDFDHLGIPVDNLEGMTFGPYFPDGTPSLIIVSDDNFNAEQQTQLWLFRVGKRSPSRQ